MTMTPMRLRTRCRIGGYSRRYDDNVGEVSSLVLLATPTIPSRSAVTFTRYLTVRRVVTQHRIHNPCVGLVPFNQSWFRWVGRLL